MKKMILTALVLFSTVTLYSQGGIGGSGSTITSTDAPMGLPQIVPPSPDVMAMQKYGEIPVGYYTGTPSISVPLYTLTTQSGVQLPISINYHASGIKVDEKASRVGLGWSLNLPGVITKQVVGIEDNTESFPRVNNFHPDSYYSYYNDYVYALRLAKGENNTIDARDADSGYDIYTYNFLGRSGKFFIDKNGNIHTIPHDGLKIVALSGGLFDITDERGNVYQFRSIQQNRVVSSCPPKTLSAIVNEFSWSVSLTKIITYKGEEITFSYRNFSFSYVLGVDETKYFKSVNFANPGCGIPSDQSCTKTSTYGDQAISSITYGDTEIDFLYSDDSSLPINGSNIRKDFVGNHALRKVVVNYNSTEVKHVEFQYDYFNSNYDQTADSFRLKLTKVIDNGVLTHEFVYNENTNLPKRLSYSQDFWGFYNGKYNSTLVPSMYYGSEYMSGADRNVDTSYTQANMLTKIIYPTKGSSSFYYENNDYYDTTSGTNKLSGGLRIAKIVNDDGTGSLESKFYSYNLQGTTHSSGIQQGAPVFSRILENPPPNNGTTPCKYVVRTNSSVYPLASDVGKYVGYTTVTERKESISSNNRTVYHFANYGPDFYTGSYSTLTIHPVDYSWKKGKLILKEMYDTNNNLVYKEENNYTYDDHFAYTSSDYYDQDKFAAGLAVRITKDEYLSGLVYIPAEFEWNYYFIKSAWVQLTNNTKTRYFGSDFLQVKTTYFYKNPSHLQFTESSMINSKGDTIKVKNYYADELNNTALKNQYRIAELLKTEKFKNSTLLFAQNTVYGTFGSNYLPSKIQTSKGGQSLEDRITYLSYDDRGNPKEVSKKDGTHIVYLWGYNKSQPIAKIENATFSDIPTSVYNSIVAASDNDKNAYTEGLLKTELDKLRSSSYCPNLAKAQITTFTYDPLVGVTSITDPRGQTMSYLYDSFNRLILIKDSDQNIVKRYEYNYKN